MARESRLARLTVVVQGGGRVVEGSMQLEADRMRIELKELVLDRPVGPATARFTGTSEGDEEFVGFLDDDIAFDMGSLSDLVDRCEAGQFGGASGVLATADTSLLHRRVKTMLFRSIFKDLRPSSVHARRPVSSDILSGGMTVYRRALYDRSASTSFHFPPDACGEDIELSFSASRCARLVLDPSVRVRNRTRGLSMGPIGTTNRALWRLDLYRDFAARHATSRRHWLAYGLVLIGVTIRGVGEGARWTFIRSALLEGARVARTLARPTLPHAASGHAAATPGRG
ncbi:MAG: glycosyltransferase [Actinomycetota bacterium]|nr:glycosyltransferase [Actinomycetota bacterium]